VIISSSIEDCSLQQYRSVPLIGHSFTYLIRGFITIKQYGGGIHLQVYELYNNIKCHVIIRNCLFQKFEPNW